MNQYPQDFNVTEVPPLTESQRDELRDEVGLGGFVGRRHFTTVYHPADYTHATDQYVNATSLQERELGLRPPAHGIARKAPGVYGDISSR